MSLKKLGRDVTLRMARTSAEAAAKARAQSLRIPSRPDEDIPDLPDDLTDLDYKGLMGLFTDLTRWADFLDAQVAVAQIDEKAVAMTLEVAEATAFTDGWGGKAADRVSAAKHQVTLDPKVQELRQEQMEVYAYRKIVEVLRGNAERDYALVSRELTRRGHDSAGPRRSNWTT
jgi:hypothetical protein